MRFPSGLKATDLTPFSCVASSPPTPQGLSPTSDVSAKLGPYYSSRHHNRHHNPVGASGVSWRFTTLRLAEIRLKGAPPQPTALYSEVRDVLKSWCPRFESGSRHLGDIARLEGPLKHCYASSGGVYLVRRMPSEVPTGTFMHQAVSSCVPQ